MEAMPWYRDDKVRLSNERPSARLSFFHFIVIDTFLLLSGLCRNLHSFDAWMAFSFWVSRVALDQRSLPLVCNVVDLYVQWWCEGWVVYTVVA